MSEIPQNDIQVEDESELDAVLESSINQVKSGETLDQKNQGQTGEAEPTGDLSPTGETGSSGENNGNSQATGPTGETEFRIPNKGKFESDEAYEKRIELFDLVKRRKAATTPEAKAQLSAEISKTKGELRGLGTPESIIQPKVEDPTKTGENTDPALEADKERLKQLGGATKEDIQEILRQDREQQSIRNDLTKFVDKTEALKDPDVREVFFEFVDANYNWQGKSGKELNAILGMAYETMFRPSETIQDRVLKGAGVQEKVNAMQFPGGTGGKVEVSPSMRASIDELKSTGMSEEKAIELLSE